MVVYVAVVVAICAHVMHAAIAIAQVRVPGDAAVDREIERMLGGVLTDDGEIDVDFEELLWIRDHPIDLRSADAVTLARLPGIEMQLAIAIVDVMRHMQPRDLRTLGQLIRLTERQMLMLRGFTSLEHSDHDSPWRAKARVRIDRETGTRRGQSEELRRILRRNDGTSLDTTMIGHHYRGAPEATTMQLGADHGGVAFAMAFAADRGEPFIANDTTGLTYVRDEVATDSMMTSSVVSRFAGLASAALSLTHGPLHVVLGDFTADFGQGLAMADGRRRFARSADAHAPFVNARRIDAYRSTDEISFLRGAAVDLTFEWRTSLRLRSSAFLSTRWLDGSIDSAIDGDGHLQPVVTSIRRDGNHRTIDQIRSMGNVRERIAGFNAALERGNWSIGSTWIASDIGTSDSSTHAHHAWSVDARWSNRSFTSYAEIAGDPNHVACVAGSFFLFGMTSWLVAARLIPNDVALAHGRAFPSSSVPQGEYGLFAGVESIVDSTARVALSVDIFRRPGPRARVPVPHAGVDMRTRIVVPLAQNIELEARVEHSAYVESVSMSDENNRRHDGLDDVRRSRLACAARIALRENVELRLRCDGRIESRELREPSGGWLTAIDAGFRPSSDVSVRAGLALFNTDDATTALYLAETDVPGRVRSVQLNGAGSRFSASASWIPDPSLRLSLAYAVSAYVDRRVIGSGLDEIDGASSGLLTLQVDWKLAGDQPSRATASPSD